MPDFRDYAIDVPTPGVRGIGDTHVLGRFLRDVVKRRTVSSETSAFSAPMRRCPMGWKRCLKSLYVNGTQPLPQLTSFSRPPGG